MTEQGEMIRFKYGLPEVTVSSLSLYTSAILEANLLPPPGPKDSWRHIMDELSVISCETYRGYVRENKYFVPYFARDAGARVGQIAARLTSGETSSNWRRRIAARDSVDLRTDAKPPDAASWLGAGTALQKWWKTVNKANWKPCAATGRSSPRVLGC